MSLLPLTLLNLSTQRLQVEALTPIAVIHHRQLTRINTITDIYNLRLIYSEVNHFGTKIYILSVY